MIFVLKFIRGFWLKILANRNYLKSRDYIKSLKLRTEASGSLNLKTVEKMRNQER